MRTVLIVSPHFPPVSAVDMHRVRMSMPYFKEFGWKPVVLAVRPEYVEGIEEPLLLETIPHDLPVRRVTALPLSWTRRVGLSSLGLRALSSFYRAGAEMIKHHKVDLVYFSTTMFPVMVLGRIWKRRFGIPYVLDMQDPWVGDYYENKPKSERPRKYWLSQRMHKLLEPWTMRKVDGIIAVSEAYHETLRARYPWILQELCRTIPFGAAGLDHELAAKLDGENPYFTRGNSLVHGVYVGVLGKVMRQTCAVICEAFRKGLDRYPALFSKARLHFIGTDYALGERARATIRPIAEEMGLGEFVKEYPSRVPYFSALSFLRDADFLLVPGSDNPQYTASKIYPYILLQKPILAVFHESSSVVDVLQSTKAGQVIIFSSDSSTDEIACSLMSQWANILCHLPFTPDTDWKAFGVYTAREMTRQQCDLFNAISCAEKTNL